MYDNAAFNGRAIVQSLPVGSTPGGGDVSGGGGASYSIPIAVPPGTNGVVPSASIEYNSQSGSGIAGLGWNISGLSAITRVPRNVYFDGATGPVELSANDRFALDGSRLIVKTGTYGAAGSTYGAEMENFATVTAIGTSGSGPLSFEVLTKDGVRMEFGNTADSRFMSQTGGTVMFWRLNRVKYPDGNYIEYVYTDTSIERDSRISEIRYTGNTVTGQAPYNKIEFAYKIRQEASPGTFSDIRTTYEAGSSIQSKYLLDMVTVRAEGAVVKKYQFGYGHDNINSYLKSVTEYGSDNSQLNPTIFKYGDAPVEITNETTSIPSGNNVQTFSGDYDGDGHADIQTATRQSTINNIDYYSQFKIWKKNSSGTYTNIATQSLPVNYTKIKRIDIPNSISFAPEDYTGDGVDDVLTLNVSYNGTESKLDNVTIYESTNGGTTFVPRTRTVQPNYYRIHSSNKYFYPGDFDGDGISEYITILGNVSGTYSPFLCSNYVIGGACASISVNAPTSFSADAWITADQIHVIDFNGDGKSDIMVIKDNLCEIYTLNNGATRIYSGNFPAKTHKLSFGDFNGDGKTDFIASNTGIYTKAISTGAGFVTSGVSFEGGGPIIGGLDQMRVDAGDFNGDGKTDICYQESGYSISTTNGAGEQPGGKPTTNSSIATVLEDQWYTSSLSKKIYYSTGDGFVAKASSYETYGPIMHSYLIPQPYNPTDVNGDGRTELVTTGATYADVLYLRKNGQEQLMQKASNGMNHVTKWEYKKLTDGGTFYTKGTPSAYPYNTIQPPMYAVYQFKSPRGINNEDNILQYSYENAKLHRAGKAFLGFGKVTATDFTSGIKTVSENEFNTTYYTAVPKKTSTFLAPSSLISETTLTNVFVEVAPKRFWVQTTNVSENRALEGAVISTTNGYDNNSNVTQSTVAAGPETTVTSSVYGSYAGGTLNRPTSVTLTRTRSGEAPYSHTTRYDYNTATGQLTTKTDFWGQPKAVQTVYGYNSLGNVTSTTLSAAGVTTRSTGAIYDSKGRYAETATDELGYTSSATYDAKWGKPLTATHVNGLITTNTYDAFGRAKTMNVIGDYTVTKTLSWDISGNSVWKEVTSHTPVGRASTTEWFDLLGRSIRTETAAFDGAATVANTAYGPKGNVYSEEQPHKAGESFITTLNGYDSYNRLSNVNAGALGNTTYSYGYSGGNTTVTITTPTATSSKTSDISGKVISATDNGGTLSYTYYSHGGLKGVSNGTALTANEYDEYARQTKLTDANAGITQYVYNALGELTWQKNGKGDEHTMAYDVAGRVTTRTGPEGTTAYEYYTDNSSGRSKGMIKKVTGFAPNNRTEYDYNDKSQVLKLKETIDNVLHETAYLYNIYGDLTTTTYPSGLQVTQNYNGNGYLTNITGAGATLYTTAAMNGQGQVTNYAMGNGKSSVNTYVNGFPAKFETAGVQNLNMVWDYQKGNLTSRNDARATVNKTESFTYDNLNRLTASAISSITGSFATTYSTNGNIATKTDAGTYTYHPAKINAVTAVTNPASGGAQPSPIPLLQQDITYTAFMQPYTVAENNYLLTYTYGADYNRIKSELKQGATTLTTRFYFSGGFEKDVTGGATRYIQYISGPTGLVAIIESNGGAHTPHYTYSDHLGSILTVTNGAGTVEAEQSFDAWGRRRNAATWALLGPTAATGLPVWLYRGYTGHEHLDQFGLINMNGRMYDPVVGRMLSPDNYVQEPGYTQSFNRYSYAWNNPLRYTDPSGNVVFWDNVVIGAFTGLYNLATNIGNIKGNPWKAFGYFGVGFTAGFTGGYAGPMAAGAILNSGNAALGGQNWQQVGIAGLTGAATGQVGAILGDMISPLVNMALPDIASPIIRRVAGNVLTGAATGGILGGVTSPFTGGGFWSGLGNGIVSGAGSGLSSGMAQGFVEAGRWGVNPWTGNTLSKYANATTEFPNVNDPGKPGNRYSIPLPEWGGSGGGAARGGSQAGTGVFIVTKEGVVLPKGAKIPSQFIENPYRSSSYGSMEQGKFIERLRIDPATPAGKKGPAFNHYHLNRSKEHLTNNWPWW